MHLLLSELYIYQNAWCNNTKKWSSPIFRAPFIYLTTRVYIRIPAVVKMFHFLECPDQLSSPPSLLFDGYRGLFPKVKATCQCLGLTDLHLVHWLRMSISNLFFPICVHISKTCVLLAPGLCDPYFPLLLPTKFFWILYLGDVYFAKRWAISGLRRCVYEIFALLGCYAPYSGSNLPRYRDVCK